MSSITLKKITKTFGSTTALNEVDLHIEGGCTAILGPNGAGKTTMMKILTRIVRPTGGSAFINGNDISRTPELSMMSVGSLVEQPEFYPYLTGREILEFICRIRKIPKQKVRDEIIRVADICGATPYLDRKTGGYSRGMKQRLGLAVTLVSEPEILILDEPTFGLDPKGIVEMRNIIRNYSQVSGKTVILSTHLIGEATEISDRVIILDVGEVKYDSSSDTHRKKIVVRFEESVDKLPNDGIIVSVERTDDRTARFELNQDAKNSDLIKLLTKKNLKLKSVTESLGIEEIYMSLMNNREVDNKY